jgi:anti-sigma factor RsiW
MIVSKRAVVDHEIESRNSVMSMNLIKGVPSMHVTEEALELYALKLLQDKDLQAVEEHLLLCELCRSSLTSLDEEIASLRSALQYGELEKRKKAMQNKVSGGKLVMFKARPA